MENFIVEFKKDLKNFQTSRKPLLKACETELALLNRLLQYDLTLYSDYEYEELIEQFVIIRLFSHVEDIVHTFIEGKKKSQKKSVEYMEKTYKLFSDFYKHIKQEHTDTQSIINAYENDKIKDPIHDISTLFSQIKYTTLSHENISKIIGMAISFNSQYAKKHKNHNIAYIEIIDKLTEYYNPDGTFKYNEDIETFSNLIKSLDIACLNEAEALYRMLNLNKIDFCEDIVTLLQESNQKLKNQGKSEQPENQQKKYYTILPETIKALQELKKYYKNGSIIQIPENMEEFQIILRLCKLDETEQKYIINLIEQELNKSTLTILKYLNESDKKTYQRAISLLNSFSYSNGDVYVLKQYIEELQTISHMLETETNEDNKQYLLNEVPSILEQLSIICDKYSLENFESTNKFIFLLNKNGIPYIYDDMSTLEQIYQKAICSLLSKIDSTNKSQFRKILSNEPLPYSMYEVINTRGHIAFIEIDADTYLIVGADIPRNGYKEFNNRLKANLSIIKQIENTVKNSNTRNEILKSNEEYLEAFTEPNTSVNKLTLKIHN